MDLPLAAALATTVTSPIHSKTQCQVSPGTHVAVLALMGLEEPPTICGVPLSCVAKSSPPSVLVKLQERLQRGNSTPWVFFIKDPEKPTGARPTPSRRAFTAHPQDSKCFHSVVNLQECQRLVAHHGHSLYTLLWGETFQTLSSCLAFSSVNRETVGIPNRISNRAVLVNLQHGTHSLNLHYTP